MKKLLCLAFASMLPLLACHSSQPNIQQAVSGGAETRSSRSRSLIVRDLSFDEAAGGHVLRRHVGRSEAELRERLRDEPHISAASTYTDRATAEQVIGEVIARNQDRIERWLNRPSGHANLVLEYDAGHPIGRSLNRDDSESRPCSHALIVLKYDPSASYHVLTSYPECRHD